MPDNVSSASKVYRILVVDDEPLVLRLLTQVLTCAGFDVQALNNGVGVVAALQKGGIDLMIIDLVMPDQEGLETIMLVRERHLSVPIIAMSGAFGGQLLKAAIALGAQGTLLKPFSTWDLLQAVDRALGPI